MAWFKSIQDIHHRMLQKDRRLALQVDVTATPRHDNGAIFVQTVSRLPAGRGHPPERRQAPGPARRRQPRASLHEAEERHLHREIRRLPAARHRGMEEELRRARSLGKKAVLFVMVDDTRNCDDVGAYLEKICPELQGAVLVIHTKNNGEISEAASGKNKEELEMLRKQANEIDTWQVALQGHRLGADAQGRLGRAQRHHHRRPACLRRAEQHPARADPGRGLRRMYFGNDVAAKPSRSWARPPSWTSSNPSRAKASPSSTCRWAAAPTRTTRSSSKWTPRTRTRTSTRSTSRCPSSPAASSASSRISTRSTRPAFGNQRLPLKPFTPEETREIVFKTMLDARGASHHPARRHRPGRLPLRRRLLRAPVAQGPAPGRRLRRALRQGARPSCASTCSRPRR